MRLKIFTDPATFLARLQPCLEKREAVNNLIFGNVLQLRDQPEWSGSPPFLAAVEDSAGEIALVAAAPSPNNLLLSVGGPDSAQALELIAESLRKGDWPIREVSAEAPLAEAFSGIWSAVTGQAARIKMRMRLYELKQVIPPVLPPAGFFRRAEMADLDTVVRWRSAFNIESLHEPPPDNLHTRMAYLLEMGMIYLWDEHGPVSMAASTRETPHGVTINGVYTPPEFRGHGYASACVAALSQQMLERGKGFCALFTDLDYPTSNAIYPKIGYRPVTDFLVITFEAEE